MIPHLLLAVAALSAPIDELDKRHLLESARVSQSHWGYYEPIEKTEAQIKEAASACSAMSPQYPREIFMLYGSVVGVESDWRWKQHDNGRGLGRIGLQKREVWASASNLGYSCSTDQCRESVWVRFDRERHKFGVWVEVRHILGLVGDAKGDWIKAMHRHNGSRRYAGDVLLRWYTLWLEPAPIIIEEYP